MKITIEFDGNEEENDARTALDGYKWKLAMWDLDQELRSIVKYQNSIINHNQTASSEEMETADKIREEIRRILENYNLSLD
jgi:ATP-dependent Zn protease